MSQAVALRPDLYVAYLHGASQWDGAFKPVAEEGVAVYIFMAENDEYYGSQKARDAYNGLYEAYQAAGWTKDQINGVLRLEIPDNDYFNRMGIMFCELAPFYFDCNGCRIRRANYTIDIRMYLYFD